MSPPEGASKAAILALLNRFGDLRLAGRIGKWASAHFFFERLTSDTPRDSERREGGIEAAVEARLAMLEPDVDVLLVEQTATRGAGLVRVFVDRPGGVDHELCARVTHHLRDLLRDHAVEVSSPGPARPLTRPDHYRQFVGRRVRVRTREAVEGRTEFRGELVGVDERGVALAAEWGTVTIPHERIRRSNLVPQPVPVPKRR